MAVLNFSLPFFLLSWSCLGTTLLATLLMVSVQAWPGWIPSLAPQALLLRSSQQCKKHTRSSSQTSTMWGRHKDNEATVSRSQNSIETKHHMHVSGCNNWWVLEHLENSTNTEAESIGTDRHNWGSSHHLRLSSQVACRFWQGMWHGYILIPIFKTACIQMSRIWDRISLAVFKVLISLINFFMKVN